jgi:hypothetical protein
MCALAGAELRRFAPELAIRARYGHPLPGAHPQQVDLELGERREDVEEALTHRIVRVIDRAAERIPSLVGLAAEIGSTVAFDSIAGDAHGYYEPATRRIVIDEGTSANQRTTPAKSSSPNASHTWVKTLCHELAHALVRAGDRRAGAVGISSGDYSIPYLAWWAESSDLEVLEHTAALIDRLASRIETALLNDRLEDTSDIAEAES